MIVQSTERNDAQHQRIGGLYRPRAQTNDCRW